MTTEDMAAQVYAQVQARNLEEFLFCYDYRIDHETFTYCGYFHHIQEANDFITHMQRHSPHIQTIRLVQCEWGLRTKNGGYYPATRSEYEKQKAAMIAPIPEQWTNCQ
jgi:hypothetical protein